MEAFKIQHWKKSIWQIPLLIIFLSAFSISCGSGGNNTSTTVTNPPGTNPGSSYHDPATTAAVKELQSSKPCDTSGNRIRADFYTTQTLQGATTLYGPFQSGKLSGTDYNDYIGISAFKDIMIVSKIQNGSTVLGYNVTMLLCPAVNVYTGDQIIKAPLTDFQVTNEGIIIDETTPCPTGSVYRAHTGIISPGYNYGYVETVFYPYCM